MLTTTPNTPAARWEAVRAIFEERYGPLYADEYHTEPLWHMAEPSVDLVCEEPHGTAAYDVAVAAETASRVADAIALLAYGHDAVATGRPAR